MSGINANRNNAKLDAQRRARIDVAQSQRRSDFLAGHLPVVDIEAVEQMWVLAERACGTFAGQGQHEGQGGVVESKSRGARHGTGHVGDAVVHHAINDVGRLGVRCCVRGLETAALVNSDIDHHSAGLHASNHIRCHQLGGRRAGDEHAADDEIGFKYVLFYCSAR